MAKFLLESACMKYALRPALSAVPAVCILRDFEYQLAHRSSILTGIAAATRRGSVV
jgi:hypothetical protein